MDLQRIFSRLVVFVFLVALFCGMGTMPAKSGDGDDVSDPLAAAAQDELVYQTARANGDSLSPVNTWLSPPSTIQPEAWQGPCGTFPSLENLRSLEQNVPFGFTLLDECGALRPESDATYPGEQLTLLSSWTAYIESQDIGFVATITYPYPFEELVGFTEGDYVDECTHDAAAHTITCTGTFPAQDPPQELEANMILSTLATCSLYSSPQTTLTYDTHIVWSDGLETDADIQLPVAPVLELTVFPTPPDGTKDVIISQGGLGPLLQWSDYLNGLVCNSVPDPETSDIYYNVSVRQQGKGWQQIGDSTNCSRQIQLGANDLSCLEDGSPAPYKWKVEAVDVKYATCRDPGVNEFKFTTGTCYPDVEVKPQFKEYFLTGLDVDNLYRVEVDWLGTAYGDEPTQPYGKVKFDLNGDVIEETGLQWGAEHTYNMGNEFQSSLSGGSNVLQITAINSEGDESPPVVLQPMVFPIPNWITQFALGNFQVDLQTFTVKYARDVE